jgi:hypothetical protein
MIKILRSILGGGLLLFIVSLPLISNREVATLPPQGDEQAYFKFDCPPYPQTFIIQLSDPELIDEARAMLAGIQPTRHIMGQVVKQPTDYNLPWSYHLAPSTIQFFSAAIEVCDASILAVEENLDEVCGACLPGCMWCPWSSRLIEEVRPPVGETPRLYLPIISR